MMMKQTFQATLAFFLLIAAIGILAGPADEVRALNRERGKAFEEGNLDAYIGFYAEDGVLNSGFSPYRIEGAENIRGFFADAFSTFPKRKYFSRQGSVRAYNEDVVVTNDYGVLKYTNPNGESKTYNLRSSVMWVKLKGRWQIVEQHTSPLPTGY